MLKDITQDFSRRHIGPNLAEQQEMLSQLGLKSINALIDKTIPKKIQTKFGLHIGQGLDEFSLLKKIKGIASKNIVARSYIGMGYYGTITPPVIQRNILENPGWYTAYTPYQAEISQGRLAALSFMVQEPKEIMLVFRVKSLVSNRWRYRIISVSV